MFLNAIRTCVGIHENAFCTGTLQRFNCAIEQGASKHGSEWFGPRVSDWAQSISDAGRQDNARNTRHFTLS